MSDQPITVQLEIPPEVLQQDIWNFEKRLRQISNITTELQEPKDIVAPTLLFIQIVGPYIVQAVAVAGGINTLHELAQTVYTFLHHKKQETDRQRGKNKVVIITKGKRIELYNLSTEEIAQVLRGQ